MAFRHKWTEHDRWERFCERHRALINQLVALQTAFTNPHRFEELLSVGSVQSINMNTRLSELSSAEWAVLTQVVEQFQNDWQSWFVATLYPAYYQELQRRTMAEQTP